MQQRVTDTRGPNLSLSPPIIIQEIPPAIWESEKAPEVTALVHPRASIIGLKKIPKEACKPRITIIMKNDIITMI
jgi:hypothetical protein